MTTPGDATTRQTLDERYGVPSRRQRRLTQVVVAVVVIGLLAWLVWAAWAHSRSEVSGNLTSFDVVSPHEVEVGATVSRHGGRSVVCDVVAQADDHATVGEGIVKVPEGGADQVTTSVTIRTEREATTAIVSNCRPAD